MALTGENTQKSTALHKTGVLGEISGAFGDLGTMLPYVIGIVLAGVLAPGPVFMGFTLGYLMVALVYRLPIPVQPMKAIGAVVLAGGLDATGIFWSGIILGLILVGFASLPSITHLARAIPQSVLSGLQAGLGLTLGAMALGMMAENWLLALPALGLLSLSLVWRRGPWALLVVISAVTWGVLAGYNAPAPVLNGAGSSALDVLLLGVIPQLPMTLLNAVVLTFAVSQTLYGSAAAQVTERKLALTAGLLNLAVVPFGALPMCHGVGGLHAHHRFGARSFVAPLMIGGVCAVAALSGPLVIDWLAAMPAPVIGALLTYAAVDLAFSKRLIDARPDCRPVIGAAALVTFAAGAPFGLAAGLVAETMRVKVARRGHKQYKS